MVGWHHQPDGHEFELGVGDGQGSLACCGPWGPMQRVGHDLVTEQHYMDHIFFIHSSADGHTDGIHEKMLNITNY